MSYRDTVVRSWNGNVLLSALLELTYRCNLDCFFCYNDLGARGRPMRLEDYERLFEDLRQLSCLHLTLSGGEPLAHPDFFAIGARARELDFLVRLKSNGHALRGATLDKLRREVDPFVVEVSLHGARAETHDRQTRVPGSFDRLLQNFEEMRRAGLRVKVNSTLTRWNEGEIEEMYAIADGFGWSLTIDPDVTPRDDGDLEPCTVAATSEGLRRLHDVWRRRAGAGGGAARRGGSGPPAVDSSKHCGAGSAGIAVDPYGNVYPCVQWRRSVGNLHEISLREIWAGSSNLETIRRLTEDVKTMLSRRRDMGAPAINFCPGAAEKESGDPLRLRQRTLAREDLLPLHPEPAG